MQNNKPDFEKTKNINTEKMCDDIIKSINELLSKEDTKTKVDLNK